MEALFSELLSISQDVDSRLHDIKNNKTDSKRALRNHLSTVQDLETILSQLHSKITTGMKNDTYLRDVEAEEEANKAKLSRVEARLVQLGWQGAKEYVSQGTDKENTVPNIVIPKEEDSTVKSTTIATTSSPDFSTSPLSDELSELSSPARALIVQNNPDPKIERGLFTPPTKNAKRAPYESKYDNADLLKTPTLADFGGMSEATQAMLAGVAPPSPETIEFSENTTVTLTLDGLNVDMNDLRKAIGKEVHVYDHPSTISSSSADKSEENMMVTASSSSSSSSTEVAEPIVEDVKVSDTMADSVLNLEKEPVPREAVEPTVMDMEITSSSVVDNTEQPEQDNIEIVSTDMIVEPIVVLNEPEPEMKVDVIQQADDIDDESDDDMEVDSTSAQRVLSPVIIPDDTAEVEEMETKSNGPLIALVAEEEFLKLPTYLRRNHSVATLNEAIGMWNNIASTTGKQIFSQKEFEEMNGANQKALSLLGMKLHRIKMVAGENGVANWQIISQ